MRIERTNTWCYILDSTQEELKVLEKILTFFDKKAIYSWKYKAKKWDGRYRLFYKRDKCFPAGLLEYVKVGFLKKKLEVKIEDKRKQKTPRDETCDISWLRDYQKEAHDAMFRYKNGIIQASTGCGKTNIAISLMKSIPCRWIFFAHKKDLIHQGSSRLEEIAGEKSGIIGDGKWEDDKRITFATFQTLNSALKNEKKKDKIIKLIENVEGVIVDEAHCASATTFWQIIMLFENALYRIGLSATPLAKDNKDNVFVMSGLGPVRYRISSQELIEKGYLAKPKIEMHYVEQDFDDFENIENHKWQEVYNEYVILSKKRNKKIIELSKKANKPSLVFVHLKKHGEMLNEELNKTGLKSRFVWGEKNTEYRKQAISDLVSGELDIIVGSMIFSEGVDIPELKSVIIASAGKSFIQSIQKIGRGMRTTKDKKTFEVFDIFDNGHPWLFHQSRKRKKAFKDEEFEVVEVNEN